MEDYEYLWLLKQAIEDPCVDPNEPWVIEATALLHVKHELVSTPMFLTRNVSLIESERELAAKYILMAKDLLCE